MARPAALLVLLALTGCPNETPPEPRSGALEWIVQREHGADPALETGFVARHLGGARLFVYAGPADVDRGLPGLVEDEGRGPAYGLLSGYFAPRVLATRSSTGAEVDGGETLRVTLPGLRARVAAPANNRLAIVLRGGGTFAFPADRTQLQGHFGGKPSFLTRVSAGAPAGYQSRRADRLTVRTRTRVTFGLETPCPRILLIHPLPRGSTSVFLVHVGPQPPPRDARFMPLTAVPADVVAEQAECSPTATSTLTVTVP